MKKSLIAVLMLLSLSPDIKAGEKLKLGLKFNPAFSFASVRDKSSSDLSNYSANGSTLKFIVGPYLDYMINDNVFFSFGLWYSPRTVKIRRETTALLPIPTTFSGNSQYNLQYLMVPLYFKFYTNEITDGLKIYFTLGGSVDFKIAEKTRGADNTDLKENASAQDKHLFSFIDAGLLMGTGVEYNLRDVTTIYAGFSYNRGLTNIVNPLLNNGNEKPYQQFSVKNNLIGLDLGLKF